MSERASFRRRTSAASCPNRARANYWDVDAADELPHAIGGGQDRLAGDRSQHGPGEAADGSRGSKHACVTGGAPNAQVFSSCTSQQQPATPRIDFGWRCADAPRPRRVESQWLGGEERREAMKLRGERSGRVGRARRATKRRAGGLHVLENEPQQHVAQVAVSRLRARRVLERQGADRARIRSGRCDREKGQQRRARTSGTAGRES
jgi:hypothetical protein